MTLEDYYEHYPPSFCKTKAMFFSFDIFPTFSIVIPYSSSYPKATINYCSLATLCWQRKRLRYPDGVYLSYIIRMFISVLRYI